MPTCASALGSRLTTYTYAGVHTSRGVKEGKGRTDGYLHLTVDRRGERRDGPSRVVEGVVVVRIPLRMCDEGGSVCVCLCCSRVAPAWLGSEAYGVHEHVRRLRVR